MLIPYSHILLGKGSVPNIREFPKPPIPPPKLKSEFIFQIHTNTTKMSVPTRVDTWLVLLFLLLIGLIESGWNSKENKLCVKDMSDGCSAPSLFKSNRYVRIFEPACIRHDVCYGCVSSLQFLFLHKSHSYLLNS